LVKLKTERRRETGLRLELESVGTALRESDAFERRRDGGIVGGSGRESLLCEPPLRSERQSAVFAGEFGGDFVVIGGGSHDGHIVKILGGGADHRRPADIDV